MTEQELYKIANKFYHSEGSELDAIKHYRILLNFYPNSLEGWADIATMQYSIADYDESIKSSKRMLDIDPLNSWNTNVFLTRLSLLKKFKFEEPNIYLDEITKEAFKITELEGSQSLCNTLIKYTKIILNLEKDNLKKQYSLNLKLATTLISYERFEQALLHLKNAIELKEHRPLRRDPTPQIYSWMSSAYLGLKNYSKSIECMDLAFKSGLDEFGLLKKADIYKSQNDIDSFKDTIEEFIIIIDRKIKTAPEAAYINQKITAFLKLKDYTRAEQTLSNFEVLKPYTEYQIKNIEEKTQLIKKEKTDNTV